MRCNATLGCQKSPIRFSLPKSLLALSFLDDWFVSFAATRERFIKKTTTLEAAESGIHCAPLPAECVCVFVRLYLTLHHKKRP